MDDQTYKSLFDLCNTVIEIKELVPENAYVDLVRDEAIFVADELMKELEMKINSENNYFSKRILYDGCFNGLMIALGRMILDASNEESIEEVPENVYEHLKKCRNRRKNEEKDKKKIDPS